MFSSSCCVCSRMVRGSVPSGRTPSLPEMNSITHSLSSTFTASQKRRPHARARADVRAAEQASQEEAAGAGLVRFGIVITATCDDRGDLPAAEAAVRQLTASARLRTRLALGNQEVAFTAALPCGLVLPDQMRVPAQLKDFA